MPHKKISTGLLKRKRVSKELVRRNNVVVTKPTSKTCWVPLPNYEGIYEISNTGKIRSVERDVEYTTGKICHLRSQMLRPSIDKDGYLITHLYRGNKTETYKVHRLVATAFIPNPNGYLDVNHIDENKANNAVSNLEWCTRRYNVTYGSRADRASEKLTRFLYQRFSLSGEYIDTLSHKELKSMGFNLGTIWRCSVGKANVSSGFRWHRIPVEDASKFRNPRIRNDGSVLNRATSSGTWKSFERVVAKFFGTKRVPLSGSNSGHNTNSDSLHPTLYIECKVRQKSAVWSLFKDTEVKAKFEKKIPVVAIKQKGEQGYLLVIRPEDLGKIHTIQQSVTEADGV